MQNEDHSMDISNTNLRETVRLEQSVIDSLIKEQEEDSNFSYINSKFPDMSIVQSYQINEENPSQDFVSISTVPDTNLSSELRVTESIKKSEIKTEDDTLRPEEFPDLEETNKFYEKLKKIQGKNIESLKDLAVVDLINPEKENIYPLDSIESMVEETYSYEKHLKSQIEEEARYIKEILVGYKRVCGDGNCFYRSAVFSWLEYLVLTKKTEVLKKIIYDILIKFSEDYSNTKRLSSMKRKIFCLKSEQKISIISILTSIIEELENHSGSESVKKAYIMLIKSFNTRNNYFDFIMILYLRYSLYEFILQNQNKIFSKDFPVLLGNLLPSKYQTEDEKFEFDKYFEEDLLGLYTCAEKLSVYLTPFVIKMDLCVFFYDFGENCDIEQKKFSSRLEGKESLYVLFRKQHFDICYTHKFFNKYKEILEIYSRNSELMVISSIQINPDNDNDIYKSKIFNRYLQNKTEKKCSECDKMIPQNDINNFSKLTAPCGCELYFHSTCREVYCEKIEKLIEDFCLPGKGGIRYTCCKCNKIYIRIEFMSICKAIAEDLGRKDLLEKLRKKLIDNVFENNCKNCLKVFSRREKKIRVHCKASELLNVFGEKRFEHFICLDCKDHKGGTCNICECHHFTLAK